MTDYNDLPSRVADRERARSTVRKVTASAGVAGLVTAGVVAYVLPGSSHHSATTTGASSPGTAKGGSASSGSRPVSWRGESDDGGGKSSSRSQAPSRAGSSSSGSGSSASHAVSGGS